MKKIMFNDNFLLTKAVLEGRKTQTRRIITPQPTYKDNCGICWKGYAYGLKHIDFNEPFGSYMNFVSGTEYDKSAIAYAIMARRNGSMEVGIYDSIHRNMLFPTKEIADDFLNCFRDLCETAKILL